jgi:hypothetical protein
MWGALRELHLEEFWPEASNTTLLSHISRHAQPPDCASEAGRSEPDVAAQHIVPPDSSASLHADTFLPTWCNLKLRHFCPEGESSRSPCTAGAAFVDEIYPAAPFHTSARWFSQPLSPSISSLALTFRKFNPWSFGIKLTVKTNLCGTSGYWRLCRAAFPSCGTSRCMISFSRGVAGPLEPRRTFLPQTGRHELAYVQPLFRGILPEFRPLETSRLIPTSHPKR